MNRSRMLFLGVLALLLSGAITLVIYRQLNQRLHPVQPGSDQIVVAAGRLPLGTRLEMEHLRTAPWAEGVPLEGSFGRVEEVIGRGVIIPLSANEPVLEHKLAPREAGAGWTSAIPDGMRAVAVKVNDVIGVAGFVLPGTRVDVIVTGSPDQSHQYDTSRVVLENVQVLAADKNVETNSEGQPRDVQVITLLVTPTDAQKLALASVDGRIQLALRNPMDLDLEDPAAVRKAGLFARSTPPAPAPAPVRRAAPRRAPAPPAVVGEELEPEPEPKIFQVELIQGEKRETFQFPVQDGNSVSPR